MALNRATTGAALAVAGFAPTIFAMSGPALDDLKDKASDPAARKQIRIGQAVGTVSVLVLSVGIAMVTPGPDLPVILVGVAMAGLLAGAYEYALMNPR